MTTNRTDTHQTLLCFVHGHAHHDLQPPKSNKWPVVEGGPSSFPRWGGQGERTCVLVFANPGF